MQTNQNKKHWDALNIKYSNVWKSEAKKIMNDREMRFISDKFKRFNPKKILDIGIGNGRILEHLLCNTESNVEIFGLDISDNMVNICQKRFSDERKIKKIDVCDISKVNICFDEKFNFITAIRILKYNKNWKRILYKVHKRLDNNGIFVFTVLNNQSLNIFSKYNIPIYRTNKRDLKKTLRGVGFEILEIKTFTRIPDIFYELANDNIFYVRLLIKLEQVLEYLFGNTFLGRVFFVAVKK